MAPESLSVTLRLPPTWRERNNSRKKRDSSCARFSARVDQLIDRRTVNLEARARQITGGAAVEFVLARRGTSPSASTAG
jgi:hypothetical protein